jgi:MFS family permease
MPEKAPARASAAPAAGAHRSFAALHHPGFRGFFVGNATAMLADNTEHVVSYWVMFHRFHSSWLAGYAVLAHWIPYLLLSGYVGALAHRHDPRRLIQLGMALFMMVSIGWATLFLTGTLQIWHAVVLLTLHGIAGVLWVGPSQLLIHDIVGPALLPSAVRLTATSRYVGTLLGPAVGSALMLLVGPASGLCVNACIYLPMLLWLWRTRYGQRDPLAPRGPARGLLDALHTLREIAGNRTLVSMTALAGAASFFIGTAYQTQMPGFAVDLGHGDPGLSYFALLAADAAGGLSAGLLLESRGLLQPRVLTALLLGTLWGVALGSFGLTHRYALAIALLFAAGFLELAFNAMAQALVQLHAPAAIRGHVIGVFVMASLGLRTFSGITVGFLGGLIGPRPALATSGAALATVTLALLWFGLRGSPARTAPARPR